MRSYSLLDRVLHRAALSFRAVRAASFDIEVSVSRVDGNAIVDRPHVFIAGLARSGTSLLLRVLHRSGRFATLTYRDMPFVLAPGLWSQLSRRHRVEGESSERAHGDGLGVEFDTPEAFEEVFWLTFAGPLYLHRDRLVPHGADPSLIDAFRAYVAAILRAQGGIRYLSKNNNNVLRLGILHDAFPEAKIIVPFRRPFDGAASLLRQHRRFLKVQSEDRFALRYMTWLGHFEFGLDHRPFVFDGLSAGPKPDDPLSVDYWLRNWDRVYRGLESLAPEDTVFWDFDLFCEAPVEQLKKLAAVLDLSEEPALGSGFRIHPPNRYDGEDSADPAVLSAARETHLALKQRAL